MEPSKTLIAVIGCGGTGSFLVPALARTIADQKNNEKFGLLLIDGDKVEPKNILRQNFAPSDIGENKARVLARRYGTNFGIPITFFDSYLTIANVPSLLTSLTGIEKRKFSSRRVSNFYSSPITKIVLISCVDNVYCRGLIESISQLLIEVFANITVHYIDAGNELNFGQVTIESFTRFPEGSMGCGFFYDPFVYSKILDNPDPENNCENGGPQASLSNRISATLVDMLFSNLLEVRYLYGYARFHNNHSIDVSMHTLQKGKLDFSVRQQRLSRISDPFFIGTVYALHRRNNSASRKERRKLTREYKTLFNTYRTLGELKYGKTVDY